MESMKKKMKSSKGIDGCDDRLSGLPDHLIVHILSFLPTLDSVKTMLLRRFGNIWTLVPSIEIDSEDYEESVVCRGDKEVTPLEGFSSFARFVKTVLMLHKSPTIDRFRLFIGSYQSNLKDRKNFCWRDKINFPVTRWKRVILRSDWEDEKCRQLVLQLVKSSPQLEELIIYNNFAIAFDHSVKCSPRLPTTYAMPLLKNVTMHGCVGDQLQLVELLLQNAVVLEKLVIYLDKTLLTPFDELNLIRQVSKFRRASANASVIFV